MRSRSEIITNKLASLLQGDRVIWLIVTLLGIFSILTVYSATEILAVRRNTGTESFLVRHTVLIIAAMGIMYIAHMINFMRYARLSTILIAIAIPLLMYTMFFGVNLNGASRWIRLPFVGITFQTSDFAKLALIIYVARTVALMQTRAITNSELLGPVLAVCFLIAPYDLSNAVVLFLTCVFQMFVGKVDLRNVFSLFMLGLGLFAAMIFLSEVFPEIRVDTWISRLYNFVNGADSGDNFQVEQAKMAIARGGYFGVGPGNGVQSHFLPHAYSDYIYCIIVEEYGLVGGIIILALYLALIFRTFRMVNKTPKTFGAMLAVGLSLSITIQAFTHMAVNVNLVPVTGLTLPFVSLGGTSLMFTGLAFGIILSVSRSIEKNTNNKSKDNSTQKTESDNQDEEFSVRNE